MKKVLRFILLLFPWLISGFIFRFDPNYYNNLNIPVFALNGTITSIVWIILYILITISIYKLSNKVSIVKNSDYFYVLVTNYLANQLFLFGFFYLKSPLLGFILTTITFISSIFLFIEHKKLDKSSSYYLIPYIVFNSYAFIVSLFVYIMNF